jgi:elongation factor Ts|tara:strand:+ start:186 stop:1046 length:861 start_codon:yes stop_codon:yes gene_type:complete
MADISASQVKELRKKTGIGLMDCKKALQESDGDIELAIVNLRKNSVLKAEKKSSRSAIEGIILAEIIDDLNKVILVEVNCETDFVSKDENFLKFCNQVLIASKNSLEGDILEKVNKEMDEARKVLIQKIGENIVIRKVKSIDGGVINFYIHSNKKIGAIVSLSAGDKELAKDIAMHVTASHPLVISSEDLSEDILNKEKEIINSQVSQENKPPEIQEKMIQGRLNKYLAEVSLVKQPYIKDPSKSVEELLIESKAEVNSFFRIEVGEGIEVEEVDFVAEVMAQIED